MEKTPAFNGADDNASPPADDLGARSPSARNSGAVPGQDPDAPNRPVLPPERKIRCVVVDDEPAFHHLLLLSFARSDGLQLLEPCLTGGEALQKIPALAPDVVLMDLNLPDMTGFECVRKLKILLPETPVLMLTGVPPDDRVLSCAMAGISGYLCKLDGAAAISAGVLQAFHHESPFSAAALCELLQDLTRVGENLGRKNLSRQEMEVYRLLMGGDRAKEIATTLKLSTRTAEAHLSHIYHKLGVRGAEEAVALFLGRNGPANR